jgi:hypothetical protein
MMIAMIRACARLVHADVHYRTVAIRQLAGEALHQLVAPIGIKLWGKEYQPLAC